MNANRKDGISADIHQSAHRSPNMLKVQMKQVNLSNISEELLYDNVSEVDIQPPKDRLLSTDISRNNKSMVLEFTDPRLLSRTSTPMHISCNSAADQESTFIIEGKEAMKSGTSHIDSVLPDINACQIAERINLLKKVNFDMVSDDPETDPPQNCSPSPNIPFVVITKSDNQSSVAHQPITRDDNGPSVCY